MASSWQKLRRLSWQSRRQLGLALLLLPITALAVRLVGMQRWHSLLTRLTTPGPPPAGNAGASLLPRASAAAHMVKVASHYGPYRANCLEQSLVLCYLLRSQGIPGADLRIGVRKDRGRLEAHAWVEWEDHPLNDAGDVHRRYYSFDRPVTTAGAGAS